MQNQKANETPHRCFTCRSFAVKCPPREDVSDGWAYCKIHKTWFKKQLEIRPGNRGEKCPTWRPDLILLAKMKELGTEFKEGFV